jgi:hypothetical protein
MTPEPVQRKCTGFDSPIISGRPVQGRAAHPVQRNYQMKLLVTGRAGFIGSCFVRLALRNSSIEIVNIDKLAYAGNLANLASVADHPRYQFQRTDICDVEALGQVFEKPNLMR